MKSLKSKIVSLILIFSVVLPFQSLKAEVVDQIVAEVNGSIITYSELKKILDPIYAQYSKVYGGDELIARVREARNEALNQIIENKLILQAANEQGLEANESAVDDRLKEIKSRFPDEETFLETLKRDGTRYDDFVDQVRDQLLIKALIGRQVTSRVIVSPKEVEAYYEKNKEKFGGQEEVHLYHIMVKKDPDNMFLSKETTQQILNKINSGDDFQQLATSYSEGPNANKGGDLGWVKKGKLIEALSEAAFSLPEGGVSELVESQGAFHILKVTERKNPEVKSLPEVEGLVENAVFREKANDMSRKWMASLREKAYINIFE